MRSIPDKRWSIVCAVVVLALLGSCSAANSTMEVVGDNAPAIAAAAATTGGPPASLGCNYAAATVTGPFVEVGSLPVTWQQDIFPGKLLHYFVGLTVKNNLSALIPATENDPTGNPTASIAQGDIEVTEADIAYTFDQGSPVGSIPSSQLLLANQFIGAVQVGPVTFDLMTDPVQQVLTGQQTPFRMYAAITLKGRSASGVNITADPFILPIDISYPKLPAEPSGLPCGTTSGASIQLGGGCGVQDSNVLYCLLPMGAAGSGAID